MAYKYETGILGGTFDRLHKGHKAFLRFAFSHAESVYVTITSDRYTSLHKSHVAPFLERKKYIYAFLEEEGLLKRAKIFSIDDVYGITPISSIPLQAIFVTEDTVEGAKKVNEKRIAQGLLPLAIELVPIVQSEIGLPISSTGIRSGIFDTKGHLKVNILHLPKDLREKFQQPFGKVVQDITPVHIENLNKIVAVGDVTSRVLHARGYSPIISVIDFVVERKKQEKSLENLGFAGDESIYCIENPAGTITLALYNAMRNAFQKSTKGQKTVIIVDGEEDLAVLAALLILPVGYTICYGQPHVGVVVVAVTKDTKEQAIKLISLFTQDTRGH